MLFKDEHSVPSGTHSGEAGCKVNEPGELWLRSKNVSLGYWNNPKANRETFVGGWLRTGDRFRYDEEGYFWYADRVKVGTILIPFVIPRRGCALLRHRAFNDIDSFRIPSKSPVPRFHQSKSRIVFLPTLCSLSRTLPSRAFLAAAQTTRRYRELGLYSAISARAKSGVKPRSLGS